MTPRTHSLPLPILIVGWALIALPLAFGVWTVWSRTAGPSGRTPAAGESLDAGEFPDVAIHLELASDHMEGGRYASALIAYEHARDLAPHHPVAHLGLMRARVAIAASEPGRISSETAPEIRYEAEFLQRRLPEDRAIWSAAMGNALLVEGRVSEAGRHFEDAVKADGGTAISRTARGLFLLRQTATRAAAVDDLEAAVALSPHHVPALLPLAQLMLGQGERERAGELAQRILEVRQDATAQQILRELSGAAQDRGVRTEPSLSRPMSPSPSAERDPLPERPRRPASSEERSPTTH